MVAEGEKKKERIGILEKDDMVGDKEI